MSDPDKRTKPHYATRLRNYFFTGLVICAPLAITVYLTWTLIEWVDGWVKPYLPDLYNPDSYLPFTIPGFGVLVAVFVITTVGFLTANLIGRSIIDSRFDCAIAAETRVGDKTAIVPSIRGRAWISGKQQLLLYPHDPWPEGYRISDTWPVKPT